MAQTTPQAELRDTKGAAAKEGQRATDAARESLQDAKSGVARTVSDATEMAQDEADKRVRATAERGADEADRSASAASEAAAEYPDGSLPNEALSRVSGFLEETAQGLRDTDLEQVTGEIRRFARRNPLAFVAGAAVVGFAAARLMRASARDDDDVWDDDFGARGYDDEPINAWEEPDPKATRAATSPAHRMHKTAPVGPAVGGRHA